MTDASRWKVGDQWVALVEKLVPSGPGLVRSDRGVVFVDLAAPGDRLRIEITEVKRDFAWARILEVLEPGPGRRPAPCPLFNECGGCDWQHLTEAAQAEAKFTLLQELFGRKLGFEGVEALVPSPQSWGYRNRIQVEVRGQQGHFRRRHSHDLIPVSHCLIAEPSINEHLKNPLSPEGRLELSSKGARPGDLFEFSQVNSAQNSQVKALLAELLTGLPVDHYLDLYAGSGNFTFFLGDLFPRASGVSVEGHPESCRAAHAEALRRGWGPRRLAILQGSVDILLPRLLWTEKSLIFVDPPRAGADSAVMDLLAQSPCQKLVYLSCNPTTLVRDLEKLLKASNLRIERVIPFDFFPQTSHCEVLVTLGPKD